MMFCLFYRMRTKRRIAEKLPRAGRDGEGVADPIGGSLDLYNQTFLEIGEELGRMLPDLVLLANRKCSSAEGK